jgi:hypothetical protein
MEKTTILLAVLLLGGCTSRNEQMIRQYTAKEAACIEAYRTGDVHTASVALQKYLALISEYDARGMKGLHYNLAKAMVEARLSLVYKQSGKSDMEIQFHNSAMQHYGVTNQQGEAKFLALIDSLDQNMGVTWRKQDGPPTDAVAASHGQ